VLKKNLTIFNFFSMRHFFYFVITALLVNTSFAQSNTSSSDQDAFYVRKIYDEVLTNSPSMDWLKFLTKNIGARLAGSPQAAAAVEYTRQLMEELGFDTVYLQPCTVPHWTREGKETVTIVNSNSRGSISLNALSLGNSVATPKGGITAEVIEVFSLDTLNVLGREHIEGKIVFFNRPLDPTQLNTFAAYGGAVDQRALGASRAGELGAVGVLVRSMTTRNDDVPHTGSMVYEDGVQNKIPGIAISTNDANLLSSLIQKESISVFMESFGKIHPPKPSFNVIGEIKGSTYPDEIILVGGHLDSWDVGEGAHDDGTGCIQSIAVLHTLLQMQYRPKRTLRAVMFMNEENGLAGGKAYWQTSNEKDEFHLAAIESDRGGFTPRGFTCDGDAKIFTDRFAHVINWLPILEPFGLYFQKGGSGADISGLKSQGGLLFGLVPDSQRYFDYHHTPIDTYETVNKRELNLGTAAMTSLVFLIDQYGLGE
jgi:carboxypeptidase Q